MLVLDRMALCYSYTSDYRFSIHENQAKLTYFSEEVEPSSDTAALMNRSEVLWPELGLRLYLGLPDSPRRFFCLLPQSVYLAPSSLELSGGSRLRSLHAGYLHSCFCLIHTRPLCLGSPSLRPFILLSRKTNPPGTCWGWETGLHRSLQKRRDTGI